MASRARTRMITYLCVWVGSLLVGVLCAIPFARAHSSGSPATATVTECRVVDRGLPGNSEPVCTGTWEIAGQQRSGEITGLDVHNREGETIGVRVVGDTAYAETKIGGLLAVVGLIGGGLGLVVHVGLWFTFRKQARES